MHVEFQNNNALRKKSEKLAVFKSLSKQCSKYITYVNETWHICKVVLPCRLEKVHKDLLKDYFERYFNLKYEKGKNEKLA